ncbi:MAG: hypothetical protein VX112_02890 [Pseudomonadota bacterium]|nr:hypothetical protein [Pseudomonadota bacterium]
MKQQQIHRQCKFLGIQRYLMAKSFSKDGKDGKDDVNPPWCEVDIAPLVWN